MIRIQSFSTQSADYTQIIDLDNITTTIRLTFNIRNGFWSMNLITNDKSLYGMKLVPNFPLINQHKAIFPELTGDFFVQKIVEEEAELDYSAIGTTHALFYYNADEVEQWRGENLNGL